MNDKILKQQHKIYKKATYSSKKKRYILKEKQLFKLYDLVEDYTENHFYWNTQEDLNYISEILTKGLINEVLEVLEIKGTK